MDGGFSGKPEIVLTAGLEMFSFGDKGYPKIMALSTRAPGITFSTMAWYILTHAESYYEQ